MLNFGIVYIIKFCDTSGASFYKIGITKNDLIGRINNLQTSTPFKLQIVKTIESGKYKQIEKDFHRKYLKYKVLNEWFCFNTDELLFLSDLSQY